MAILKDSFDAPYNDRATDKEGFLTSVWADFIRAVFDRLYPLGVERSFTLANNQSSAADVVGLKVNSRAVSHAIVEFLVQRVTTGESAVELIEAGAFTLSYNPAANDWNISLTTINVPENSGVDFTVTASGQVQYTSSNITGDPSISRVVYRMRTLGGKSSQYSSQGAR